VTLVPKLDYTRAIGIILLMSNVVTKLINSSVCDLGSKARLYSRNRYYLNSEQFRLRVY